jgi:hypothetical protein
MADTDEAPTTERDSDADEPRPITKDEDQTEATPAPESVPHDDRALAYPPRSRLFAGKDNTLRIDEGNSVRVPAVDFVASDKPTEELTDMEQLENLERLGKVWLQRQQLKPDPAEPD